MKYYYRISTQFANPHSKFGENEREAVDQGILHYNSRSLIAKNPKKITSYSFLKDELTLEIVLESDAVLPMPSKALRVLSSYLVEETDLDQHLYGKQLFKMSFVELYGDPTVEDATDMEPPVITKSENTTENYLKADEASSLARINKYLELLMQHTDLEKIREIDEILMRED